MADNVLVAVRFRLSLPLSLMLALRTFRCLHFDAQGSKAFLRHQQNQVCHASGNAFVLHACSGLRIPPASVGHGEHHPFQLRILEPEPSQTIMLYLAFRQWDCLLSHISVSPMLPNASRYWE